MLSRSLLSRAEWVVGGMSALVVAVLTWQVMTGGYAVTVDRRVYADVGRHWKHWILWLGNLGSIQVSAVVLAAAAVLSAGLLRRWLPIALAVVNAGLLTVVTLAIKHLTDRIGPGLVANRPGYPGYFPSGHTATSAVCFGTALTVLLLVLLARRAARRGVALRLVHWPGTAFGLLVGALVGTMTVLSANHWVSDVVAGLGVAAVVQIVGAALVRRPSRAERAERAERGEPAERGVVSAHGRRLTV